MVRGIVVEAVVFICQTEKSQGIVTVASFRREICV